MIFWKSVRLIDLLSINQSKTTPILTKNIVLTVAILLLGACAAMQPNKMTMENINLLIADQEFARAEQLLNAVDNSHPDYEQFQDARNALKRKRKAYEISRIEAANSLKKHDQWAQAEEVLETAILRSGATPVLVEARSKLNDEKLRYIEKLNTQYHLYRGEKLNQEVITLQKLALAEHNSKNSTKLANKKQERLDTAEQLKLCGDREAALKNLVTARKCYQVSLSLHPSQAVAWSLLRVTPSVKKPVKREPPLADAISEAKAAFTAAKIRNDWQSEMANMELLLKLAPEDKVIKEMSADFNQDKSAFVNHQIHLGQLQYSEGQVQQALETWTAIKSVADQNAELDKLILRAKKFTAKLAELRTGK